MSSASEASWQTIYDFVLSCGSVHDPRAFGTAILERVQLLCPYDQARIYYVSGNGRICNQYLKNIDKRQVTAYHEYYSKLENGRYSIPLDMKDQMNPARPYTILNTHDWVNAPADEFVCDYIRTIGISYSLGFSLYDVDGSLRMFFMLDRTSPIDFSDAEIRNLCLAIPQLNNLHKNFYSRVSERQELSQLSLSDSQLTGRENEIATLLCQGVSPANISSKLHIAQSTAYKHIAHIYDKMHVSSRQELLVRLLAK